MIQPSRIQPSRADRSTCTRLTLPLGALVLATVLGACSGPTSVVNPSAFPSPTSVVTPSAPPSQSTTATKTPSRSTASPSIAPVPVESNPPGDIPDNLAFVPFTNRRGHYTFTYPEGWAEAASGNHVRFTDKLNGVTVDSLAGTSAPTVSGATSTDVPRLRAIVPAFELRDVSSTTVPGGQAVRIVFRRNSDGDPVTGKVYRDEVEEYIVFRAGRTVRMDLYGPVGADNVDAYRTMVHSLKIT